MVVCAVILGILGLIASVVATAILGWMGGAVAIVLGAAAIILGLLGRKKKGKGGFGPVVVGVVAVVMSIFMITSVSSMMTTLKDNLLKELNKDGSKYATVSKYAEKADTNTGFVGFISSMAGNVTEEDKDAFEEEIKTLADLAKESTSSAPASEPAPEEPAEEPAG